MGGWKLCGKGGLIGGWKAREKVVWCTSLLMPPAGRGHGNAKKKLGRNEARGARRGLRALIGSLGAVSVTGYKIIRR